MNLSKAIDVFETRCTIIFSDKKAFVEKNRVEVLNVDIHPMWTPGKKILYEMITRTA